MISAGRFWQKTSILITTKEAFSLTIRLQKNLQG